MSTRTCSYCRLPFANKIVRVSLDFWLDGGTTAKGFDSDLRVCADLGNVVNSCPILAHTIPSMEMVISIGVANKLSIQ